MDTLLQLLKLDLGITHVLRDEYFIKLLESSKFELEGKGIIFDETSSEDTMLIVDYAAWIYRKRQEDIPVARHLTYRIRNRIIKGRAINNA